MSIVYEPKPRYVVETADVVSFGSDEHPGAWNFHYAFERLDDAMAMADRLAEEHQYVRVIDRHATKENA